MHNLEISKNLHDLNFKILKLVELRYKELGMEITPIQGRIILGLYKGKNNFCQTDIRDFVPCNKSTLSSILDTMEKNNLIIRMEASEDSRKKIIILTEKSQEFARRIIEDKNYVENTLCNGISEENFIVFNEIINKMSKNLERM